MTTFDAYEALHQILDDVQTIIPIGHHYLGRHLVYLITQNQGNVVVKFYFKNNKWNREVSTLQILANKGLCTPNLIDYGHIFGIEYLVMEYIHGSSLEDASDISKDIVKEITIKAGNQLALIHKNNQYDIFGILNEDTTWKCSFQHWYNFFMYEATSHIKNIKKWKHSNPNLIYEGIKLFHKLVVELKNFDFNACLIHNDISERNIFIHDKQFVTLIDFEQSCISERYRELVLVEYHMNRYQPGLFESFLTGYQQEYTIEHSKVYEHKDLYLLHYGISICSWSQEVDTVYYNEGVKLIQNIVTKYKNTQLGEKHEDR